MNGKQTLVLAPLGLYCHRGIIKAAPDRSAAVLTSSVIQLTVVAFCVICRPTDIVS
jgi:hypothetical protein